MSKLMNNTLHFSRHSCLLFIDAIKDILLRRKLNNPGENL